MVVVEEMELTLLLLVVLVAAVVVLVQLPVQQETLLALRHRKVMLAATVVVILVAAVVGLVLPVQMATPEPLAEEMVLLLQYPALQLLMLAVVAAQALLLAPGELEEAALVATMTLHQRQLPEPPTLAAVGVEVEDPIMKLVLLAALAL
jgi:hypothetical protein